MGTEKKIESYVTQLKNAAKYIKEKIPNLDAKIGITLGSGLQSFGNNLSDTTIIPYSKIPNFPTLHVKGHKGRLVHGKMNEGQVLIFQGRCHLYENYTAKQVCFYVRILQYLDVEDVIITNAAGGINRSYTAGDFVILRDQINFSGSNPLLGIHNTNLGTNYFQDMSEPFNKKLANSLRDSCYATLGKTVCHDNGCYLSVLGPNYESPAEVRMFRIIGADLVGMSTVNEVIAARNAGINVGGLSLVTNMATGVLDEQLEHSHVVEMGKKRAKDFVKILTHFFTNYFKNQKGQKRSLENNIPTLVRKNKS